MPDQTLPKTRAEAKALGAAQYYTGKPCKQGHDAPKFTCSGSCTECLAARRREYMREWAKKHPEVKKERAADWYDKNRERVIERVRGNYYADLDASRQRARDYAAENRVAARTRAIQWRKDNPDKKRAADVRWKTANPHHDHSLKAKYRAVRRLACPPWVDAAHMDRIHAIYRLRREITEQTGIPHEVDHIVPLQGKTVCGLHVWWNLRVIPKTENNRRPRIWSGE